MRPSDEPGGVNEALSKMLHNASEGANRKRHFQLRGSVRSSRLRFPAAFQEVIGESVTIAQAVNKAANFSDYATYVSSDAFHDTSIDESGKQVSEILAPAPRGAVAPDEANG